MVCGGLDADVAPVLDYQLDGVDGGRLLTRRVEQQGQGLPVRTQPEAVAVTLRQPERVEQLIGALRIVVGVGRGVLRLEQRRQLHHGRLSRLALAVEHELIDLLAIDRQRQRLPEKQILEQLAQHQVGSRLVEEQRCVGADPRRPLQDAIVAPLLVVVEQREVGGIQVAHLEVELARHGLQVERLDRRGNGDGHLVDVGKLVAGLIHLPVVGIALVHRQRRGVLEGSPDRPRVQYRVVVVLRAIPVALVAEELGPVLEPGLLGHRLHLVGVGELGVKLLHVVLRCEDVAAGGGKVVQQQPRRRGEGPTHRRVVDLVADGQLAGHQQPARLARREVVVAHEVVEPEDDVVGRERLAVGPLHAVAQVHGDGATVFGELPVADHVRNDQIGGAVPACREVVRGVAVHSQLALRRDPEGPAPAVLAHLLDGLDHHRLRG